MFRRNFGRLNSALLQMLNEHLQPVGLVERIVLGGSQALQAEVRCMSQIVEVAWGMSCPMMGDSLSDLARGLDGKTIRQPIGVCIGITLIKFPAILPMWMYSTAPGNIFVLKPSETFR
jgi:malonate-semialdehyde dehydrogenase (acetylating)/methylmalonate-semialdehyde dehydrogenase